MRNLYSHLARLVMRAALSALPWASPSFAAETNAITHQTEIDTFARIMAETTVAQERCPGMAFDDSVLAATKDRLRVEDEDYFVFHSAAHRIAEDLRAKMAVASDPAWCAEVYGRYGPDGSVLKGALKR